MKYVSEADLRAYLINDGCDDGCGYLDERDIPSLPWIELDDDEKQKVGHWIDTGSKSFEFHRVYKCSECGNAEIEYPEAIHGHFRYCPHCGTKMVEEQEGKEV